MLHLILAALLLVQSSKDVASSPLREANEAAQEDWITKVLHYMESNPETLEELMSKDYAVLEGDILLLNDRNAVESVWPSGEIPFTISPESESRTEVILSAMEMVSEHTCVSFHRRTSESSYLTFFTGKGCASYVGLIGGEQPVFVGAQCMLGNIVHEILHALGFHHEHTRSDRDQYITVLQQNIMDGKERNFRKQSGETFDLEYNAASIMHYGGGFFSDNGLPTIVSKEEVMNMGQRKKMMDSDVQGVRLLYSCGTL
ncbi:Blastula protease 10 [Dissostichus eleginoides]|uniref:Metalloendopeptidase n=1 Tax=Dissostichus eleginoides TaxID=100907 RepID=A0AAD9F0E9_DISEL|nr:Blastula protease 10 [Dissostichus eleginoides]